MKHVPRGRGLGCLGTLVDGGGVPGTEPEGDRDSRDGGGPRYPNPYARQKARPPCLPETITMTLKKMQWPGGAPAKIAIL
jgi:hypothetical protein